MRIAQLHVFNTAGLLFAVEIPLILLMLSTALGFNQVFIVTREYIKPKFSAAYHKTARVCFNIVRKKWGQKKRPSCWSYWETLLTEHRRLPCIDSSAATVDVYFKVLQQEKPFVMSWGGQILPPPHQGSQHPRPCASGPPGNFWGCFWDVGTLT